jgi:hypothetical protein
MAISPNPVLARSSPAMKNPAAGPRIWLFRPAVLSGSNGPSGPAAVRSRLLYRAIGPNVSTARSAAARPSSVPYTPEASR